MKKLVSALGSVLLVSGSAVTAQQPSIYTMVSELRQQSRTDALAIKEEYRPLMQTAIFTDLDHLRRATDAGELVPLSAVALPHVQPRLTGESPIAQKDLENQQVYVALRPAAMGMLIDISRRVAYGPLEVTSVVRTSEYQRALMRGNGNANTDVPTHAMGYAVDIGLKYAPEGTAKELRRVLEEMRAAGDIYFIAEANQLTMHIVPVRSRIPHFEAIYQQARTDAGQPAPAPEHPAPSPAPAAPPQPVETSRFADMWNWITGLFD